jgi:hypothetical protein
MRMTRATSVALLLAGCWTSTPAPQEPVTHAVPDARPDVAIEPEVIGHVDLAGPPVGPAIATPGACPSTTGLAANISNASTSGTRTLIEIDAGTAQGVTSRWTIGGPAGCVTVRLDAARLLAACAGTTAAQVLASPTAVLCAPVIPRHASCPSGIGFEGRIIGIAIQGADQVVTIAGGLDRGVDATWTTVRPACPIQRVGSRVTVATCAAHTTTRAALLCAP